jgi:Protein of unknown function (DUF3127).
MDLIGKLEKVLPEQRGEGARGPWVRCTFVITTEEQFPRQVAIEVWGEERFANIKSIPIGTTIKTYFNAESREFNERWYTTLRCYRVDSFVPTANEGSFSTPMQSPARPEPQVTSFNQIPTQNTSVPEPPIAPAEEGEDDLPF